MTRPLHSVPEPIREEPPAGKLVEAVREEPNSYRLARTERYAAVIHQMHAEPNVWFRIVTWPGRRRTDWTLPGDIRKGKRGFGPPGTFEPFSGFTSDNKAALWCRYTPREHPPVDHHLLDLGDMR